MSLLHPKTKNLRVGMNVRFRMNGGKDTLVYKIIGRDRLTRTRFNLGRNKWFGEDGYRLTINHVHENELERA